MPIRLVATAGRSDILLDRVLVVVGRHPLCDARVVSPRVSRWHCCLTAVAGGVCVRDLNSTNGTWINGRRVTAGRVRRGDVISIAHIRYRIGESRASEAGTIDSPKSHEDNNIILTDSHDTALCDEISGD
jgi:pSer/pThr/pTyr-binding forkhead associated (FHA) protein